MRGAGDAYVDPNGLVIVGGLRSLTLPVDETVDDLRVSRRLEWAGQRHDVTEGLPWRRSLLDRGVRITAIGGSDNHRPDQFASGFTGLVGLPTTVVLARELSSPALLDGIRAGRVHVDLSCRPKASPSWSSRHWMPPAGLPATNCSASSGPRTARINGSA